MSIAEKLEKAPPYKLLALDGGGIRGVITLEVLREMEAVLQKAHGRDDRFVLADYFDYLAGTSTGATSTDRRSRGSSRRNSVRGVNPVAETVRTNSPGVTSERTKYPPPSVAAVRAGGLSA